MSSSDSESDDENLALLRAAADTTLFSDAMFNKTQAYVQQPPHTPLASAEPTKVTPPSQRYLTFEEHDSDLKVTESMQNFVYKKMCEIIEKSVEFVDVDPSKPKKKRKNYTTVIKLLKDTDAINLEADKVYERIQLVKPDIRKRQFEADKLTNEEKIRAAAVDISQVSESTKSWKEQPARDKKFFKYKEKSSNLYFVEPENEFTKLRKKNNWSETKISKFKHKYKTEVHSHFK